MKTDSEIRRLQERIKADREALQKLQCQRRNEEVTWMSAMPVIKSAPCVAAILPDGTIAVHVWVEGSDSPNQLHFVRPSFYDHDAKRRKPTWQEQVALFGGEPKPAE